MDMGWARNRAQAQRPELHVLSISNTKLNPIHVIRLPRFQPLESVPAANKVVVMMGTALKKARSDWPW